MLFNKSSFGYTLNRGYRSFGGPSKNDKVASRAPKACTHFRTINIYIYNKNSKSVYTLKCSRKL